PKPATSHRQDKIAQAYDKLPISFEPNQGQAGKRVKFLSHGGGYLLLLSPSKAALVLTRTRAPGIHQLGGAIGQRRIKEAIRNPVESRFAIDMKLLGANG